MNNAGDRKQIRAAEKRSKLAEANRREAMTGIMSTIPGRAWMLDILESCNIFADPFSGEALTEAFSKGQRNVGLRLLDDIMRSCPDDYIQMMRERNERDTAHDRRNSDAGERAGSEDGGGGDQGPDPDIGSDIYADGGGEEGA